MKIYFAVFIFFGTTVFLACNNQDKKLVNQTEKDSLSIKDSIDFEAASTKSDDYYNNFDSPFDTLIGCWAAIRAGNITITFSKDSTFEFYDYNSKSKEEELLTGRFELNDHILTLFYNDRPKQRFNFKRDAQANDEYRITNAGGYYF